MASVHPVITPSTSSSSWTDELGLLDQVEPTGQPLGLEPAGEANRFAPWRSAIAPTASATPSGLHARDGRVEVLDPLGQERGGVPRPTGSRS